MTNPYKAPKTPLESKPLFDGSFSVKAILMATFIFISQKPKQLALSCLVPFCGFLLISYFEQKYYIRYASVFYSLANLCFYCLLAINLHRLVLASDNQALEKRYLRWGQSEWQFLGYSLLLYLCYIPIGFIFFIPNIGIYAGVILALWFTGRFCLIFPSVALNEGLTLRQSWIYTGPFQFRIFMITALLYGIFSFPLFFSIPVLDLFFINSLVEVLTGAVLIISVSFIYHQIKLLYLAQNQGANDETSNEEST